MSRKSAVKNVEHAPPPGVAWNFRLYVADQTPRCIRAFANLKRICDEHLAGIYRIEVVDLLEKPHLASDDQILAVPTLVRRLPGPMCKLIGDLSNTKRVLAGLDLPPAAQFPECRS